MKKFNSKNKKQKVDRASFVLAVILILSLLVSSTIAMVKNNETIEASKTGFESDETPKARSLTAGVTGHIESILKENSEEIEKIRIKANDVEPVMASYSSTSDEKTETVEEYNSIEIEGVISNTIDVEYSDIEFESDYDPDYYEGYGDYITTISRNISKYVPSGYGKVHTYMGWQCVTNKDTKQYRLRMVAQNFDSEGFGKIGDRYAVAMKPYYGEIGDYLDITQSDGSEYKVVIVDYKGRENGTTGLSKYIHHDKSIIEFVVDKGSWYSKSNGGWASEMHSNPGTKEFHPELGLNIVEIKNVGNYWDYDHELMDN